ncbi:MAG: hypothetical protein JWO22_1995 [Frankiales bacterium]|nr:hypothetical protein [Frankiales bacterium]
MTAPALAPVGAETVVGRLARCAEDLARLVGGCLIEGADGRLVAHRLPAGDVPPAFVTSVLAGDARALHAALVSPRTTTLLPTGPVVEGVLSDSRHRVAHVYLRSGAGVWLLPSAAGPLDLEHAPAVLQQLEELLSCRLEDSEDLAPWLDGDADVPACWRDRAVHLARVEAPGVPIQVIARNVTCGTPVRHRGAVYVVLESIPSDVRVDPAVRVVVSGATTDLVQARRRLDAALPVVPLGSCLSLEDARPRVVVRHLAEALDQLPDLGPDPLSVLREHDCRRSGELVTTVRAWLDAGGDVVRTADVLQVHSNTLRYRLRRAFDLLGTDLRHDPATRLELHLRLVREH